MLAYFDTTAGNTGGDVSNDGCGHRHERRPDAGGGLLRRVDTRQASGSRVLCDGGERRVRSALDVRVANAGTGARFHVGISTALDRHGARQRAEHGRVAGLADGEEDRAVASRPGRT